jgi:DNA-binding response OmpR family regulator
VVRLSNKAYQLMEMLMEHPHVIHSVDRIMEHVWGWDAEAEINVVWVNISYLRKQLSALGSHVEIRVTRGAGYSLENKEQSE